MSAVLMMFVGCYLKPAIERVFFKSANCVDLLREREKVLWLVSGFWHQGGRVRRFKEQALRTKKGKKPSHFTASGSLGAPTDMTKLSGGRFQISAVAWERFQLEKGKIHHSGALHDT